MKYYSDIYISYPVHDSDSGSWRLEHLWFYTKGRRTTYTTSDCDGNHEPCSAADAKRIIAETPSWWDEYGAWVAETGEDPLGNYWGVTRVIKRRCRVQMHVRAAIGRGLICTHFRRNNRRLLPKDAPRGLLEWALLKRKGGVYATDWKTYDAMLEDLSGSDDVRIRLKKTRKGVIIGATISSVAEWDEPRDDEAIRRDLKKAARK